MSLSPVSSGVAAELPGCDPRERGLIAQISRYHRKGAPKLGEMAAVARNGDEQLVARCSVILRLAEHLERGRDGAVCLKAPKAENEQQNWLIGDGGAVANVVVWLQPADGSHFEMAKEDLHPKTRTWPGEVVVGLPHLNFTPRVVVLFPSYFDPVKKKQVATGQVFTVVNDSPVACDVQWQGGPDNPGEHRIMPAKGSVKPEVAPARMPGGRSASCGTPRRGAPPPDRIATRSRVRPSPPGSGRAHPTSLPC